MFGKALLALAVAAPLLGLAKPEVSIDPRPIHPWAAACEDWDEWDKPGPPFKIHGNTYYVGTCGISSILITTGDGHALIDSGTEAGADVVLANIRTLGFDPQDIKLLLGSHEHFDHLGGLAKIQKATGAMFVSSAIAVYTMITGEEHPDDPQFGLHEPMAKIAEGIPYDWGDAPYRLDNIGISPIPSPGHTPGAMSWSWQSCEGEECRTIFYADSLSPVSADDYRFLDHREYLDQFFASLERLAASKCDVVMTPHPSGSAMRNRLLAGDLAAPWAFDCLDYTRQQRGALLSRLTKEDPELKTWTPGILAQ